jgi:hypothetical protein
VPCAIETGKVHICNRFSLMLFSRMRAGDANKLVLIETSLSAKAGEVTGVFDGTTL